LRNEKEYVCSKIMSVCVCSKIIKELPDLVGSGTPCIRGCVDLRTVVRKEGLRLNQLGHRMPPPQPEPKYSVMEKSQSQNLKGIKN
jgi:hypothetical protein